MIPKHWRRYTIPKELTVIRWIADFAERVKQLERFSNAANQGGAKELKVTLVPCYGYSFDSETRDKYFAQRILPVRDQE